ncbi:MAG: addiction module antidote protein, HigA family [Thiotrichaceae bacterium IS1]|nr:MAG: addiction module antidote protein, HigA family [Thiotrichaceae bacterium IS1]
MAILFNELERTIPPTHPGEMLKEDFLPDYGLIATTLARTLGVSSKSVNDLLNQRRGLSLGMALRLARLFGNTPEFWLNAQRAVDVWEARPKYHR